MSGRGWIKLTGGIVLLALLVFAVTSGLERLIAPPPVLVPASVPEAVAPGVPHITATLFYGTADAQGLSGIRREVPLATNSIEQGRQILVAQMEERAPDGLVSVIPEGTTVRAFYVTDKGDAFVDLSSDVSTKHSGGSAAELLTVHAIVNAVTANLPGVQRVQILIDGKEAETLAGHVDLRRPLPRDTSLVTAPSGEAKP